MEWIRNQLGQAQAANLKLNEKLMEMMEKYEKSQSQMVHWQLKAKSLEMELEKVLGQKKQNQQLGTSSTTSTSTTRHNELAGSFERTELDALKKVLFPPMFKFLCLLGLFFS